MGKQINWKRAAKPKPSEDKFAGTIMNDGTRVRDAPTDGLAKRAREEAKRWARTLSTKDRMSVPNVSVYDRKRDDPDQKLNRKRK